MIFTVALAGFQKGSVSAEGAQGVEKVQAADGDSSNIVEKVSTSVLQGKVEKGTKVELQCSTTDAAIHFTLDGTEPTEKNDIYTEPITVNENLTIKAFAVKEEMNSSDVSVFTYIINEENIQEPQESIEISAVTANISSGDVEKGTEIKLSSTTGAAIHFTIDGTVPTTRSAIYLDPIKVDRDMTVKAFSAMEGCKNSEVVEFKYTLKNSISVQNICDVDKFKVGELAEIKMLIGNNTAEKKDVTLLMASYDENNSMLNYVLVNENIGCRERVELSGFMRVTEKSKVIRCFAIDSLDEMTPISNTVIVPVE
jgi:chitobiase/beta-hexosaminidase-like protein